MNHINDIHKFQQALDKYRLTEPIPEDIPEDIQKFSLSSKRRVFKRIMKTLGKYTLISGVSISIYFFLKKMGISTLIAKITIAATLTASLATASYYTVQHFSRNDFIKPVKIEIMPQKIDHKAATNWTSIAVFGFFPNNNKKDITAEVTFSCEPTDLAKIEKKDGAFKLVFTKQGKGTLKVHWKDFQQQIAIAWQNTIDPRSIYFYQQKYGHVEKIYLKDGNIFTGVLVDQGEKIMLITPNGDLTLEKSDIDHIEYNILQQFSKKKLIIDRFKSSTFDNNILIEITNLVKNLTSQVRTTDVYKIDGQVDKIGEEIYVSMKLVNVNTHKLQTIKSTKVRTTDEVKTTCASFTNTFIQDFLAKE